MSLKQKNMALITGFVILLWLVYQFSIDNTIEVKHKYNALSAQKEMTSNVPEQISYLKQQNTYYNSILEKNKITVESSFQNNLLQIINSFVIKNELKIVAFDEPHEVIKNDAILKTYTFKVKGTFNQILKLLNTLEQYGTYGKMISINFYKNKNYKTNIAFLECEVFLQRIERVSYDK